MDRAVIEATAFGTLLKRFRLEAELTQEELAEKALVSARAISDLERGVNRTARRDTVRQLIDALELSDQEQARLLEAAAHEIHGRRQADARPASEGETGLRTFLIADVRGYTSFTEEFGDEAAAWLVTRFADLIEEVITEWNGLVIELRGDEALAVFGSARNALRAAVAIQARFQKESAGSLSFPLGVGVGLAAGEAVPVKGGYRGRALNIAARLCSMASAGDVFVSTTVTALAGRMADVDYVDRGEVSLKGLTDPIQVIQIAPPGALPASPAPLQEVLLGHPGNLPDAPTRFIGREQEIAAVSALLQRPEVRLITLTGPGGVGKTRLAMQVGATLLYELKDGVFLVAMASVGDSELVASTIANAVGVKEEGGRALRETLTTYLRDKQMLLILDNFEHLLEACPLVTELLDTSRRVKVMVTSRSVLHLSREHVFEVTPFSVPDPERLPDLASLSRYESVALFMQQAQAARAGFTLTADNASAVAEICRRLDGLPLAIELAAAQIRLLSPRALLGRLSRRLQLLTGGPRDAPARHRTVRSTLDWSYALLEPPEQTLFARLGAFNGGFTLEAAEKVCGTSGDLAIDVLDGLGSLVKKSIVRQDEGPEGEPRFTMLETIREYAAERLEESGEADEILQRHTDYYLSLAEQAAPTLRGAQQALWLERLEKDHDNLRASLRRAIDRRDTDRALRLALALNAFWTWNAHWTEARRWLNEVLAWGDEVPGGLRARVLLSAGSWARVQGEYEQADLLLNESLVLAEQYERRATTADALNQLGILAAHRGNHGQAITLLERSLALARELGDRFSIAQYLDNLGLVMMYQGDYARATTLVEESLALYRELEYESMVADVLRDLSWLALHDGNYERARDLLKESLGLSRESRHMWLTIPGLEGLARASTSLGQPRRAVRLWAAVEALREGVHISFPAAEIALHERYVAAARAQLDASAFAAAWEEGRAMTVQQAIAYALQDSGD